MNALSAPIYLCYILYTYSKALQKSAKHKAVHQSYLIPKPRKCGFHVAGTKSDVAYIFSRFNESESAWENTAGGKKRSEKHRVL